MAEYIERKAAIKAVEKNDCEGYASWAIKSVPVADVRTVVRGKWKLGVCQTCFFDWSKVAPVANVPNFCPNCGAMMDKDSFDDNPPMEYFESGGK